ncbi:MAG TPA: hypothetical protein VFH08_18475 [Chitinophagaceae bacterium]|nr:hypothetical protein [Chitinophagaceae bacterium]
MSAIAYNLKKLLKWEQRKIKTAVMTRKKAKESPCFSFLSYYTPVIVITATNQSFYSAEKNLLPSIYFEINFSLGIVVHQSPPVMGSFYS